MANTQPLKAGFFDIGNTLGAVSQDADKFILNPFDTTQAFLRSFQDALGFKLGIITNILPEMTDDVVRQLVAAAGLLRFLDDGAIVTNRDAGSASRMSRSISGRHSVLVCRSTSASTLEKIRKRLPVRRKPAWPGY